MSSSAVITIDGPAGVGKSTVGRQVAIRLGLPFVDTGIFYRALTVAAAAEGIAVGHHHRLAELAQHFSVEVNTDPGAEGWRARVGSRSLDLELWQPGLAPLLAYVASQAPVRRALLGLQRAAGSGGAVAVGRDTGTAVFPDARCKFYLEAPEEVRLERRRVEFQRRGLGAPEVLVREDVVGRDHLDLTRKHSPLTIPPGAVVIDTEGVSAAEVVDLVLARCRAQGPG
ncbi:MAG TPA: (d)CMP kinase [Candidatus Nanopelagicaceae bacterium]|nr:(d)CMP kinase [Candidatus Nanopelagicaceae bacterium]